MTTTPTSGAADLLAMVSKALREAYNLGQRYWQQADSEYISQRKKADDTRAKFLALVEETCAALAAGQATAAQQGVAYAELEKKHADFVETVGLMLAAIGYKEDYARQWPKEKASVTFRRWFDEQRASHGQAPAYEAGWKDGYKQGAWSATAPTAKAAECAPAPVPPPECKTEAEKRAFAFGWFKALESERMKAESVQEDAARYRLLRRCKGQEHEPPFTVQHEIDGTLWGGDLDAAIAAARARLEGKP